MTKPESQTYRIAGPATWELIRAAYLAGESAPALAARYSVSEHSIRKRITREKWTKRDYAAALEARSLPPPPGRERLTIAERFAETHVPPKPTPAEDELATDAPLETAALLERRALAQTGAALAKGRAADAKTFAALADQMRKRLEAANTFRAAEADEERANQEEAEDLITHLFVKASYIANAMVYSPNAAPAAFQGLVKLWREHNLGEGEEDAEKAAAKLAESQRRFLDGDFEATLPDEVRERLAADWRKRREVLANEPLIPHFWRQSGPAE